LRSKITIELRAVRIEQPALAGKKDGVQPAAPFRDETCYVDQRTVSKGDRLTGNTYNGKPHPAGPTMSEAAAGTTHPMAEGVNDLTPQETAALTADVLDRALGYACDELRSRSPYICETPVGILREQFIKAARPRFRVEKYQSPFGGPPCWRVL